VWVVTKKGLTTTGEAVDNLHPHTLDKEGEM
jgi:hypothetical protein